MVKQAKRPAPVLRLTVVVRGKSYECLVHLHDASAPVLVGSQSQAGFWIVARGCGVYSCACPAYDFRRTCSHIAAAQQAETLAAEALTPYRRPEHLDDTGPAEDEEWDAMIEQYVDGLAAAQGPYFG